MYQAVYKCRLCGEKFKYYTTVEFVARGQILALSVAGRTEDVKAIDRLYEHVEHECDDGSFGFADFQGFKKTEE